MSDDPATHAESIQKLFDAGVTQVFIHAGQSDQMRAIEFYGREVLPYVRRERERTIP
ncbi:MAG: hypothetical protein HC822_04630 [Oscillochloris sp.]|nr:hypothetical protein [Oscillochloris sp.]